MESRKLPPFNQLKRANLSSRAGPCRGYKRHRNESRPIARTANEIEGNLVVALIDSSNPAGKMTPSQWELVEARLVDEMLHFMDIPHVLPIRFDDAGWQSGVKLITCADAHALDWLSRTASAMPAPWPDAKLKVVNKAWISSPIEAQLNLPRVMPQEQVLNLLRWQNPDVPTADWLVVCVKTENKGQKMLLKISKEASDLLSSRHGRMCWGMGTVRLQIKKQHKSSKPEASEFTEVQQVPCSKVTPEVENAESAVTCNDQIVEAQVELMDSCAAVAATAQLSPV